MKATKLFGGSVVLTSVLLGPRDARAGTTGCDSKVLPEIVCDYEIGGPLGTPNGDCCWDLEKDSDGLAEDKRLCSQAAYWRIFSPNLDPNLISQHERSQNLRTTTFTAYPGAISDGGSTWAQHYVSVQLLGGVDYLAGESWHESARDYMQTVKGNASPYHGGYATVQRLALDVDPGEFSSARMQEFPFDTNELNLQCDHFLDSPIRQASTLVHESWHLLYGGHDGTGIDYFYRRPKSALGPGEMNGRFNAVERHDDGDRVVIDTIQSVFQTQLYYLCDIIGRPRNVISNRTLAQARFGLAEVMARLNIPFGNTVPDLCVDDYCVTGFSCLAPGLNRDKPRAQPFPGEPPVLTVRLDGLMQDETPVAGEDTQKLLHLDLRNVTLVRGGTFEESPVITMTRSDDDTRFDFNAQARLKEDGETVEVRFQAAFYEDPPDCELDTSPDSRLVDGQQCLGLEGPQRWKIVTLDASPQRRVQSLTYDLNNHWNEGDNDWARFTVEFTLDY